MDKIKEAAQSVTGGPSNQFEKGHKPAVQEQPHPGLESKMDPPPQYKHLPSQDKGYELYKAAGKLVGKKALITGADSGIGRAVAILYAMEGADVAISYLPEEEEDAQFTKQEVEKIGGKIYLFPYDLTVAENCRQLVAKAVDALGGLNILINNAAYQMQQEDITQIPDEQWMHTFNVNIHAFFHITKAAYPHLKSGDAIINTTSVNAYMGPNYLLDYSSTKGAIVAFTRVLSSQSLPKGIRVNAVAPGPIWTPLVVSTMGKELLSEFGVTTPMGRPGQPSEVATCYVFLGSNDSSYISGQVLHPNGGVVVNG